MALVVLATFSLFGLARAGWLAAQGDGSRLAVIAYLGVAAASVLGLRVPNERRVSAGWIPFVALPALYAAVPNGAFGDGRVFDALVQDWEAVLFGYQPARSLASQVSSATVSELLHIAYLSYYPIIYGSPLVLWSRAKHRFGVMVLAFTLAMVGCMAVFAVFPVEGPRYAWPPPPGIPSGPSRDLATAILRRGSSHGTAFPSSHVAIALALGLSSFAGGRWLGIGVTSAALLLAVGAVYGGFHYAIDVIAGAGVGIAAWVIAAWVDGGEPSARRPFGGAELRESSAR